MDSRTRLKALMGIKEEKGPISDDHLEIEYETELANIDSYRRRLVTLHQEWEKELAAEKAETGVLTDEDGHDYNPATFVIEKMGLSNKATMTLKQMGFLTFGDFEHADAKALEEQVLIGRKNVQTIDRILEAYGLKPLEYSNPEDEVQSEDDEQATEQEVQSEDDEQTTEQEPPVQEEVVQEAAGVQEPPVHEETVQDGEITAESTEASPETMVEDGAEEDVEVEDDLDEEDIYPEDMPAKTTPEEDFVDLDDDDF